MPNPNPITTDALIVVYVDTANIPAGPVTDLSHVYLGDNQKDPEKTDPRAYVTQLQQNSQIAWFGAVMDIKSNPNDYVLVTGITMTDDKIGITIRDKNGGRGKSGAGSGDTHIDAIPTAVNSPKKMSTYTISFTVRHYNPDGSYVDKQCTIDPKLNMN